MPDLLLKNALIAGEERSVAVTAGFIAGAGAESAEVEIDLGGASLLPGFIDVHNHGAIGIDVNEADADGLIAIGTFLARNGVTAWLPTFVPDSESTYSRVVGEIEKVVAVQESLAISQIVGVHYEGVFANTQMCGALRPEYFRTFTGSELELLPTLSAGTHMTTIAPEIDGGVELVRELTRRGWVSSIGHTKADPAVLDSALAAGARHMTHFFNAMTGLHHRDVGVVGWGLTRDVTIDIIADGIHVHPEILKFVLKEKGDDAISLISDSIAPTGLGDGDYEIWDEKIEVRNNRTRNERGSIAGSVITMLDAVRNYRQLGASDQVIAKIASTNPARLIGVDDTRGSIEAGKRADLVAIDADGQVSLVLVGGKRADGDR